MHQKVLLGNHSVTRRLVLAVLPVVLVAILSVWGYHASTTQSPRVAGAPLGQAGSSPLITTGQWRLTALTKEADALLTDPRARTLVLAGTPDGVWTSADAGRIWHRQRGSPLSGVVSLSATSDGSQFVAGGDSGVVYGWDGHSGDGWQPISPVLAGGNPIFSLAISPSGAPVILAGSVGGVYRGAQDGGHWTWTRVLSSGQSAVAALTWLPWQRRTAYAGVFGSAPALLRSTDGGRSWEPFTRGLPTTIPTQALLPITVPQHAVILTTMGSGVWRLTGTGTWQDISGDLPQEHGMPLAASPGDRRIFTGTMGWGVFGTQTAAIDWQRLGRQLNGGSHTVLSLALVTSGRPYILAGTALGVYRYSLQG